METPEIIEKARQVREERRTKRTPWKQYELENEFKAKLRQPKDETIVFRPVASLGKLWMRNNSMGYAYEAITWVGFTEEVDGDRLENPQLMLLELELAKMKTAEIGFDLARYRSKFTVDTDGSGKVLSIVKGKPRGG